MDQKHKSELKYSELLYYLFIASLLFAKGIGLYDGQTMFKIILIFSVVCWCGKMILTDFSVKELMITAVLLILGVVSYRVSGDKGLLLYIMLVIGAKEISMKKIFHVSMWVWGISFGSLFMLTALHIIDSPFKVHEKMGDMIIRWGLGYSHPNVLHVSYLIFCLLLGYYLAEKMNLKWLLLMMAGNAYVFLYSVSFTGVIAVTFYLVLCGYLLIRKKVGKIEVVLVKVCSTFCLLFSLFAPILLQGKAFEIMNKMLNTRLNLSRIYLTQYPISLLGRRVAEITDSSATMDCSYVYAYVAYGIIIFALLVMGYAVTIHQYCKKQKGKELAIILACLVSGVTEPFLFNASFKNVSLLFLRDTIYRGNSVIFFWHGSKYDKTVKVSINIISERLDAFKNSMTSNRKTVLLWTGVGVILGILACGIVSEAPSRIIVPRSESDVDEAYRTELNIKESDIREGDIVYGQPKEGTPWMQLTGRAVELEQLRNLATAGFFAGGLTMIVAGLFCFLCRNGYRRKIEADNER